MTMMLWMCSQCDFRGNSWKELTDHCALKHTQPTSSIDIEKAVDDAWEKTWDRQ